MVDNAIQQILRYQEDSKTYGAIQQVAIYLVDSVIHLSNKPGPGWTEAPWE